MNIHPIFVHFPIAFLTIYALGELLYIKKIRALPYAFYCKAFLVIVGSISALITLQTGEMAAEGVTDGPIGRLIETHSDWANAATIIFCFLGGAYAVAWLNRTALWNQVLGKRVWLRGVWGFLTKLSHLCIETPLVVVLALAGLCAITVTGALGGSLVYGPDVDPVVHFIYNLLIQ